MAIANYTDLVSNLGSWSDRGTELTSYMPTFVSMATESLNYGGGGMVNPLRVRDMMIVDDLTPSSGVCTLPTDYLQYRRVVELASTRRELTYVAPGVADQNYPSRPAGLACDFTIIGASLYMFPVSSNDIEITYYQAIPDLTVSATTNWLITKHPTLYLHTALMHLAAFVRDDQLAARSSQVANSMVDTLNKASMMSEYANAGYRIKGLTP